MYSIKVSHLSKKYRIGSPPVRYPTIREALTTRLKNINLLRAGRFQPENSIWALQDVTLDIQEGETLGIIGRNGAGKSTLLKILSRITRPTRGRVEVRGRVGSLLEVGTGFHLELTGRENIYLNGAILGMKRFEINRKFDEIIAFAEIEKFLDTPVKHYSSGMYTRLAFAVAAHLEPEILLVDEVLSVGDAEFQSKCLGKMGDVAKEGRTVLFVSHNMGAVISLCNRGILLDKGHVVYDADIHSVVSRYINQQENTGQYVKTSGINREKLSIEKASLINPRTESNTYNNSDILRVDIECEILIPIYKPQIAFEVWNEMQHCIFCTTSQDTGESTKNFLPGKYLFQCEIPLHFFREGRYRVEIYSSVPGVEKLDTVDLPLSFNIYDDSSPILKIGSVQERRGIILPTYPWKISQIPESYQTS